DFILGVVVGYLYPFKTGNLTYQAIRAFGGYLIAVFIIFGVIKTDPTLFLNEVMWGYGVIVYGLSFAAFTALLIIFFLGNKAGDRLHFE
ncbi:MAG: hypothetical protein ACXADH_17875, partial [Candidatus Kariarchaeaceae archaeon]